MGHKGNNFILCVRAQFNPTRAQAQKPSSNTGSLENQKRNEEISSSTSICLQETKRVNSIFFLKLTLFSTLHKIEILI